jgi:hypothetical protein
MLISLHCQLGFLLKNFALVQSSGQTKQLLPSNPLNNFKYKKTDNQHFVKMHFEFILVDWFRPETVRTELLWSKLVNQNKFKVYFHKVLVICFFFYI